MEWSTFNWQVLSSFDKPSRGVLMMHELFHRVERPLGLMTDDGQNSHLDTLEGRYWQLLEWRALARALGSSGTERTSAVHDALRFRYARRQLFPAAAANEVLEEIREGLAHYTGTVTTASSPQDAESNAIRQLADFAQRESLVRDFGYASGSAYGILLDAWSPGWTRQVKGPEDLAERLRIAGGIAVPGLDSRAMAERAALRYDSTSLRSAEEKRDAERKAKVAELRKFGHHTHPRRWNCVSGSPCNRGVGRAASGPSPPARRSEQHYSACSGQCARLDARRRWVDAKNSSGLGGACRE